MQTWKGPSQMVESNSRASQSEVEPHRCAAPAIFNSCEQHESTAPWFRLIPATHTSCHKWQRVASTVTRSQPFGMWWNRRFPFVIFYNTSPQILLINNFCLLTIKYMFPKRLYHYLIIAIQEWKWQSFGLSLSAVTARCVISVFTQMHMFNFRKGCVGNC